MLCEMAWEDAHNGDATCTFEEAAAVHPCVRFTVGYLIRADKEYVVLAGTDDRQAFHKVEKTRNVGDTYITPTCMVRSIRILEKATRR
jgi:hypothetical protein